ncbi:MAG: phosphotransferase family protein [Streptomycetaceae bacterium]|nr:phosphotransferase family protein [Streptomycetaceae bacterium]
MTRDLTGDGLDALARWLSPHLGGGDVRVALDGRPGSGFSAETVLLRATTADAEHRLVLRRETADPAMYPAQAANDGAEIAIQYRTMRGLAAAADIPVAPLIGYEDDPAVLGSAFFVMGFVDGWVPVENPPYTAAGPFLDAAPADRRTMIANGLDVLARLHRADRHAADLDWLVPPGEKPTSARQFAIWSEYAARELDGRDHPVLDRARAWLHANLPEGGEPGIAWGDARPGNIIWRGIEPVCVTDFEAVAIAPPELDLGWWLFFDRTMHEALGIARLDGEPDRAEQRALYAAAAGRDPGDTTPFEVLAGFRYAAIVVRAMNRGVARGEIPAAQTIWRDNPPATALRQLLDEIGA